MAKKALSELMSYANCIKQHVIVSWERHLPSGQSPLKSL